MLYSSLSLAVDIRREQFPIEAYAQDINTYISPDNPKYNQNILTPQNQALRLKQSYNHYYSSDSSGLSPWSESMVNAISPQLKTTEIALLNTFNNQTQDNAHQHYAENFRKHDAVWWHAIQKKSKFRALRSCDV
jgi:hypothetical protein